MAGQTFAPLAGTVREAALLGGLFPAASVLTGEEASEETLKRVHGPRILHIATHGFFLPDRALAPAPVRTFGPEHANLSAPARGTTLETPLVRSGLALAGANRTQRDTDDGIMTALELSSIDLYGTHLVVLSACDTGVGTAEIGEGVFGLRRALVLAGSETQVVSLWKVDDEATTDLMSAYYVRLLAGEGRSEALHEVQRAFLRHSAHTHRYYWASFIVSGDPAPLPKQARALAPIR